MCYTEIDSLKRCCSRVKVGRWATIKERQVRFEEEVLHHLSSSAAFFGTPLLTVGIEISQNRCRRGGGSWPIRVSSSVILYAVEGERYTCMEHIVIVLWHVALSAISYRPVLMCSCWWGVVFLAHNHEESHYFPQQVYHSMNNFWKKQFCYYGGEFLVCRRLWGHTEITVDWAPLGWPADHACSNG